MGDNRDNSLDSRVQSGVGFVPAENLVGRAQLGLAGLRDWTLCLLAGHTPLRLFGIKNRTGRWRRVSATYPNMHRILLVARVRRPHIV